MVRARAISRERESTLDLTQSHALMLTRVTQQQSHAQDQQQHTRRHLKRIARQRRCTTDKSICKIYFTFQPTHSLLSTQVLLSKGR